MVRILSFVIEILALAGLFVGYARKGRGLMLFSGLVLLLGGPLHNFIRGFVIGIIPH